MSEIKEKTITPADRKFMEPILSAELKRVKSVAPHPHHDYAVQLYRKQLAKTLKKLNPRGYYYE
jgi:hypothetical protein